MDWLHIFSELEKFLEFAITYFAEQELDYYTIIDGKSVTLSKGINYHITMVINGGIIFLVLLITY